MTEIIEKALKAKRESKQIEFKQDFNPDSPGDWCELIKDIVAIANSGGGIIVFGLDNTGTPLGKSVELISQIDPADITNKLSKYIGPVDLEFDISLLEKEKNRLVAFVIQPVAIPLIFQKPGTYEIGSGKQRSAFSVGTVYFRHGAKSEPGNTEDIRKVIERQLEQVRTSWIKGVKKVVQAPRGSQIVTILPSGSAGKSKLLATSIRAVNDPSAIPVRLTRDPTLASGALVHEQVSDGIFDEINNVIDANRILSKGQIHFFLGEPVYYRVYAERYFVKQDDANFSLLFYSSIADIYGPAIYWALSLSDKLIAQNLAEIYVHPKNPNIYTLMRMGVMLGPDFCDWLYGKWHQKWKRHPQPPHFYWTFQDMIQKMKNHDPRLIAARASLTTLFGVTDNNTSTAKELLEKPDKAASVLSLVCIKIFEGHSSLRTMARSLDYIAYGHICPR